MSDVHQARRRILIVDDNPEIHDLVRSMLSTTRPVVDDELRALEGELFDAPARPVSIRPPALAFEIESAFQGADALRMIEERPPYFLAFVDMRMPPGIDGLETIRGMWLRAPYIYTVICSAYSDHSWDEVTAALGDSPNLLILRKPFETIEIRQIAAATARMYDALAAAQTSMQILETELLAQQRDAERWAAKLESVLRDQRESLLVADDRGVIVEVVGEHGARFVGRPIADCEAEGTLAPLLLPDAAEGERTYRFRPRSL